MFAPIIASQLHSALKSHYSVDFNYYRSFRDLLAKNYTYYFAAYYSDYRAFIEQFDNPDHVLNAEEELEFLTVTIKNDMLHYSFFHDLVYHTSLYQDRHFEVNDFIKLCYQLHQANLLTIENISACNTHLQGNKHRSYIPLLALSRLHDADILDQEHFDFVMRCSNPTDAAKALAILQSEGLNNAANREVLIKHLGFRPDFSNFLSFLEFLKPDFDPVTSQLVTQDNISKALQLHYKLSYQFIYELHNIAHHNRTQAVVNDIFDILNDDRLDKDSRVVEIENYCRPLHWVPANLDEQKPIINNTQSTHTTSVHSSVSRTATTLMSRYQDDIKDPMHVIREIEGWLNSRYPIWDYLLTLLHLPTITTDTLTITAARALTRLKKSESVYIDRKSNINTQQFIALCWKAIHDDAKRIGELNDALDRFLAALSDVQRGYNMDNSFVDRGGNDLPICQGGTFNKFGEALVGIDPDAELIFITKSMVSMKLPIVVLEEIESYLMSQPNPAYSLKKLQANGVESIWSHIVDAITDRIFDEFGSLYSNNRNDPTLVADVDCGKFLSKDWLTRLAEKMTATVDQSRVSQLGMLSAQRPMAVDTAPDQSSEYRP